MVRQAKGQEGRGHLPQHLFHGEYRFGNTNEVRKKVNVLCVEMVGLTQNETIYGWPQMSKRHLVWFLPGTAFHRVVNQLFSPAGFKYQGAISLKPFFLEKPGFQSQERAAENTVSLAEGVKQLHLFFVTHYHSLAVKLAPKTSILIKQKMISG